MPWSPNRTVKTPDFPHMEALYLGQSFSLILEWVCSPTATPRVLAVVRGGLVRVDRLDRLLEILGQPVHSLVRDIVVLAVGQLAVRVTWAGVSLRAGGTTSGVTD